MLVITGLSVGYNKVPLLTGLNLTVKTGEITAVLGANGIGKTTVFHTVLGNLPPIKGSVTINGKAVSAFSAKELARTVGYIPQTHNPPFPFTVLDVVVMGRTARLSLFASPGAEDENESLRIMREMGIEHLAEKPYTQISGGERQLVLIARALAQNPQMLIMDEPTAFLDFGNQILLLKKLRELAKKGIALIFTTHSPDHALQCADKAVIITASRKVFCGAPDELLTDEILFEMYGAGIEVRRLADGRAVCVPAAEVM